MTAQYCLQRHNHAENAAQLGKGDGKAFTEPLHGGQVQEILRENPEEKEQAIARVGDDKIWEDSVGMAAGTGLQLRTESGHEGIKQGF